MTSLNLEQYSDFVFGVTSDASKNMAALSDHVLTVATQTNVNLPLLLTGAMGLCGEAGEFSEVVKKVFFHGKSLDEATLVHLKKELSDVIWYWTNACRAIGVTPQEVIDANVEKLSARYPGGFSTFLSENRIAGDI